MIRRIALVSLVVLAGLLSPAVGTVGAALPDPMDDPMGHISLSELRPRTYAAKDDRARVYDDGCHVQSTETAAKHCIYGRRDGTKVVVVVGDSIVAQWWAAIDGAAKRGGWRVVWMSKTACPPADVTITRFGKRYTECDTWRRNVLAKVRNLPRVDLLLMAGSSQGLLLNRTDWSVLTDPAMRGLEWQEGYQRTIDRVAGQVRRVLILRDTPVFRWFVPECLRSSAGWTKPCSRLRTKALEAPHWLAEVAVDAQYSWVRAIDMAGRICQPERCWPVTSNRILRYRDSHHLTNTYATALAPAMWSTMRWVMR
jgi:hypothetical protein